MEDDDAHAHPLFIQHLLNHDDDAVQQMIHDGYDVNTRYYGHDADDWLSLVRDGVDVSPTTVRHDEPLLVYLARVEDYVSATDAESVMRTALALPGLDITARDGFLHTPWHAAVLNRTSKARGVLQQLLNEEAAGRLPTPMINDLTSYGMSALHLAARERARLVKWLLRSPMIQVNVRTVAEGEDGGQTPLFVAAYENAQRAVEALVNDARTDDTPRAWRNAMHHTPAELGRLKLVQSMAAIRELLRMIAHANTRTAELVSAGDAAAAAQQQEYARTLLHRAVAYREEMPDVDMNEAREDMYIMNVNFKQRQALRPSVGGGGRSRRQRRQRRHQPRKRRLRRA